MEIFDEICNMVLIYHLHFFTDFVEDPELRYSIGWSFFGIVCLNMVVHLLVVLNETLKSFKKAYKERKLWKCCLKKQTPEEIEAAKKLELKREKIKKHKEAKLVFADDFVSNFSSERGFLKKQQIAD
jgi:hypothetical protein